MEGRKGGGAWSPHGGEVRRGSLEPWWRGGKVGEPGAPVWGGRGGGGEVVTELTF